MKINLDETYMVIDRSGKFAGPYDPRQLLFLDETGEIREETKVRSTAQVDASWVLWSSMRADAEIYVKANPPPAKVAQQLAPRSYPVRRDVSASPHLFVANDQRPQLSRAVYIFLAVFLGALGIHNLYAGYMAEGLAQMIASVIGLVVLVVAGPIGLLVMAGVWIWAIIDIVRVSDDAEGNPMR